MFGRTSETSTEKDGISSLFKIGIVLILVLAIAVPIIGIRNNANRLVNNAKAQWTDNQNTLSNYTTKLIEAAQIPAQYKKDFIELVKAEMEGRYGEPAQRKQALANWVQERQLNFDSSLYGKLQAMIESGRNEFKLSQTKLIDIKREYETTLGTFPQGLIMSLWGYSEDDVAEYTIVITEDVQEKFKTGTDKPISVFGN